MTPATSQPDFGRANVDVEYYEDLSLGVRRLQIEEIPSDENLAGKLIFYVEFFVFFHVSF